MFWITKTYNKKLSKLSTQRLTLMLIVFCVVTLVTWSLYAWHNKPIDLYILGANLSGFFFSVVLLFQFWRYS
jgi:hypothetical protein